MDSDKNVFPSNSDVVQGAAAALAEEIAAAEHRTPYASSSTDSSEPGQEDYSLPQREGSDCVGYIAWSNALKRHSIFLTRRLHEEMAKGRKRLEDLNTSHEDYLQRHGRIALDDIPMVLAQEGNVCVLPGTEIICRYLEATLVMRFLAKQTLETGVGLKDTPSSAMLPYSRDSMDDLRREFIARSNTLDDIASLPNDSSSDSGNISRNSPELPQNDSPVELVVSKDAIPGVKKEDNLNGDPLKKLISGAEASFEALRINEDVPIKPKDSNETSSLGGCPELSQTELDAESGSSLEFLVPLLADDQESSSGS